VAFGDVGGALLFRYYDLYQWLQVQFYILLMMGAMDTRNMYSDFAVNKYLLVKLNVELLWLKLHSTRRRLFLLAHWTWK